MSDSFVIPWTIACQASLSMGFPRQAYWGELPFPSPGDLPKSGIELKSPALAADFLPLSHLGSPLFQHRLAYGDPGTLATSCEELTHWKRLRCWEGLGAGGEGDDRGWDGWMISLTRWTWVWVNSGSWWWTGRPGMLRSMGSQRVGHDWATELKLRVIICPTYLTPLTISVPTDKELIQVCGHLVSLETSYWNKRTPITICSSPTVTYELS